MLPVVGPSPPCSCLSFAKHFLRFRWSDWYANIEIQRNRDASQARAPVGKPRESGQRLPSTPVGYPRATGPASSAAFHCFRCNQPGHRAAECPAPAPRVAGTPRASAQTPRKGPDTSKAAAHPKTPSTPLAVPGREAMATAQYRPVDEESDDDPVDDPMGCGQVGVATKWVWPPKPKLFHRETKVCLTSCRSRAHTVSSAVPPAYFAGLPFANQALQVLQLFFVLPSPLWSKLWPVVKQRYL
ncbi:hypothetical protein NXF25_018861 [Crotalus adamanteus]|uniref:CCHC-type domain-containing protein n=1 Tax=Crotalus adamanteus TaxID=8729 RepID=A0AAW1B120_CROAD